MYKDFSVERNNELFEENLWIFLMEHVKNALRESKILWHNVSFAIHFPYYWLALPSSAEVSK